MELRQLEYVVAVVEHGTFTAAAEAVHVAQPSLSQGIRTLEAELGVQLFHRVGRRAVLAPAGEAFAVAARQALRDAATAREAALAVAGLQAGRLDIATLPTLAVEPLSSWVGRFRALHPGVTVAIVEPETARGVGELVRSGASELGLAELPVTDDLVAVPVGEQEIVAVAPAASGLTGRRRVPLERLADHPVICTPPGTSTRRLVDEAFAAVGREARIAVETTNREALIALVAAGAGIAFVPRAVAEASADPAMVVLRSAPPIRRQVGLVHRRGTRSPAAEAFLAVATGDAGSP